MKLLDSTFLLDYWDGEDAVREYLERREEAETFVSSVINLKELAVGRAIQGKLDRNEIRTTFGWVEFLPFEPGHAFHAAEIEANLHLEPGVNRDRINALAGDVLIAAVAKANGATVVTRNVDDFEVFEDVAVETY